MKLEKEESGEFTLVDEGVYEGTLQEIEESVVKTEGQDRPVLKFIFEIEDEDGEPVNVNGLTSQKFSTQSKLYAWAKAMGIHVDNMDVGEEMDTDDILGAKCLVKIENRKLQGGSEISNVTDVSAMPKKTKKSKKGKKNAEDL